ncbi:hypothetical protein BGZ80_005359 [Entomortierella chlamydospora]|uniref:CUE domain-containing protein n=1 Tax=Entomortierella chlamydospora TaxID=101097 RepID=A0A9P6MZJ1_9FUNG|nr:hypothetical protein BGZ79_003154 [Entomortierella chlamydospora]KAG0019711.1 hypothetical protein BGZ80_005359 [Entomortierella chlamydospora]
MSSAYNTLLQYLLIISVAYIYSKALRTKKNGSSSMGGPLDKLQTSGLKGCYIDRKKRAQAVNKRNSESERGTIRNEKGQPAPASASAESTPSQLGLLSEGIPHNEIVASGPTPPLPPSPKKQPKRSNLSPPNLPTKRNISKTVETSPTRQQQPRTTTTISEATSTITRESNNDLPISAEEAESHYKSLCEMFKDIPSSEIDRVIRYVHWDVDEAAALLAQEDYTWQSVRHRRSVPR